MMMIMVIMVLRMETLFCMETKDRAIMVEVMVEDTRSIAVMMIMEIVGQEVLEATVIMAVMEDKHIHLIVDQWGELDMVMVDEVSMIS